MGSPSASPSSSATESAGYSPSEGISHRPSPPPAPAPARSGDPPESNNSEEFIPSTSHGDYVPRVSVAPSRVRRAADSVADAVTEIDQLTLKWILGHPGLRFPEDFAVYPSNAL
ncbi:hypothetical protein Taro_021748 [Colocasia esculenta]|uniref:Uncharacterized protein n=1 Tax=Colocasia esculenta TaxID=4460 RepID=A0A843V229_COLES|nr:hypothetical protein [Colocasia esculenta]